MNHKKIQPAIKSYFFGKGYRDLGGTISESWSLNWESAGDFGSKAADYWSDGSDNKFKYFPAVGAGFAAFSVVVFGTLFFLALSAIHITILAIFFTIIYLSFSLFWLIDKLYRVKNKMFVSR